MVDGPEQRAPITSAAGVVITTYNHAHFLGDAIESVLAQTRAPAEILVVDDGSTDDPGSVVARYPGVRLIRQANQGLAAARNTGLGEGTTDKVIFLDADDRLLAHALAAGLSCFAIAPASGFVYGGFRRVCDNGRPRSENYFNPISAEPYRDFLKGNLIGMHAAVMYDRGKLIAIGGFDPTLKRCEDYDVYLRMSRSTPIASYPEIVAEYRWHGANISANHREMLDWSLRVHRREALHAMEQPDTAADWRRGRTQWRDMYVRRMLADAKRSWADRRSISRTAHAVVAAMTMSPVVAVRQLLRSAHRRFKRRPRSSADRAGRFRRRHPSPPPGSVNLGDLNRVTPISATFGFDRGTPVDRYYIERFLEAHAADIAGSVLEARDDSYSRRFGGSRITRQDVLDLSPANAAATIVGDLSCRHMLPDAEFDCLVMTQTLQFVFDMRAAVVQMHEALKPGGVLLLTVPGISPVDRGDPSASWCWSLVSHSAFRLFSGVFGDANLSVESHGNVYAATALLQGLAVEEIDADKLDVQDPSYPVIVTVRAQKAGGLQT
jgi:glycosyltransferase involved in cell wall biosynthesis